MVALNWLPKSLVRRSRAAPSSEAAVAVDGSAREIEDDAAAADAIGTHTPVILLFDSSWRGGAASRTAARLARQAAKERVQVLRVDADRHPEIARRLGVHAIPTVALFHRGQLVSTRLGELPDEALALWLDDRHVQEA